MAVPIQGSERLSLRESRMPPQRASRFPMAIRPSCASRVPASHAERRASRVAR
jgi:hypothetical protein